MVDFALFLQFLLVIVQLGVIVFMMLSIKILRDSYRVKSFRPLGKYRAENPWPALTSTSQQTLNGRSKSEFLAEEILKDMLTAINAFPKDQRHLLINFLEHWAKFFSEKKK